VEELIGNYENATITNYYEEKMAGGSASYRRNHRYGNCYSCHNGTITNEISISGMADVAQQCF